jgi:hypothetical protein
MPWSVGGAAGKLDIVFYGSSFDDGTTIPDNYPATATWHAYLAQDLHATRAGSSFQQTDATGAIHRGGVCESGVTCTGNRDLYDDFGVAVERDHDGDDGYAVIVYDDDQYRNTASFPAGPGCTPADDNTPSCLHTSIATQVAGPRLYP